MNEWMVAREYRACCLTIHGIRDSHPLFEWVFCPLIISWNYNQTKKISQYSCTRHYGKKASCNKQSPELKACSLGSESPKLTKCTTHLTEMVWCNFLIDLCLLFKMRYFVLKVPLYPKYFPEYFVLREGGIGNQLREPNALQESEALSINSIFLTIKKKLSLSFLWD